MATLVTLDKRSDEGKSGFRHVSAGKHLAQVHKTMLNGEETRATVTFSVMEGADRGLQISQRYSLDHDVGKEQLRNLFNAAGVAPVSEDQFDLDELRDKNVCITVKHTTKDDKTYANVVGHAKA